MISREIIQRLVKDRRVMGKVIGADGELVESGYEPAIDEKTWQKAQRVKVKIALVKKAEDVQTRIMHFVPAFRWELAERIGVSRTTIEQNVKRLKEKWLNERDDGLLQRRWEPFPEKRINTRIRNFSIKRRKIISILLAESSLTSQQIGKRKIGRINCAIRSLLNDGIIEKKNDELQLSEIGLTLAKAERLSPLKIRIPTPGQDEVLRCLLENPEGLRFSELNDIIKCKKSTLTGFLRRLREEGNVAKMIEDGKWYITESGKQRLKPPRPSP